MIRNNQISREIAVELPPRIGGAVGLLLTFALIAGIALAVHVTQSETMRTALIAGFGPIILGLGYLSVDLLTDMRLSRGRRR